MPKHLATWNPARTVWETTAVSLFCGHSVPFSETLPTSGITLGGELFERPMSGPATDENVSSSSPTLPTPRATRGGSATETVELMPTPKARDHKGAAASEVEAGNPRGRLDVEVVLLPTPTVSDGTGPSRHGDGGMDLRTTMFFLPTPTAQAAKHGETPDLTAASYGSNLWDIPHLLPTPTVNDMGEGKTLDDWDTWTEKMQAKHGNGNGHGRSLAIEAQRIGDHTPPPSTDGNKP